MLVEGDDKKCAVPLRSSSQADLKRVNGLIVRTLVVAPILSKICETVSVLK